MKVKNKGGFGTGQSVSLADLNGRGVLTPHLNESALFFYL
tara:strand:- start:680 stop:799 length:120 start_codon:yes stop_codon:yes gene_type:complete